MNESENVLSQHRVGDKRTDFHVALTPKPAKCFGIREILVALVVGESEKVPFSGDLASLLACKFI
jgi:hypothetical protein